MTRLTKLTVGITGWLADRRTDWLKYGTLFIPRAIYHRLADRMAGSLIDRLTGTGWKFVIT